MGLNQSGGKTPPPLGVYQEDKRYSSFPVDNQKILTTDRVITAILETGVNSQLGNTGDGKDKGISAPVILQVSRDVFGYHGKTILIPQGSRLICNYLAPDKLGLSRIGLNCKRLLLAGSRGEIFDISSPVTDPQGRDGAIGEVDNRFWEKYGTAFVLAGISTAVRVATAVTQKEGTSTSTDSTTSQSLDAGSQELSTKLGEITAAILEQTVNLKPIITLPQGTRLQIRPMRDLYLTPKIFKTQEAASVANTNSTNQPN